jgi:hypothetical protein
VSQILGPLDKVRCIRHKAEGPHRNAWGARYWQDCSRRVNRHVEAVR